MDFVDKNLDWSLLIMKEPTYDQMFNNVAVIVLVCEAFVSKAQNNA